MSLPDPDGTFFIAVPKHEVPSDEFDGTVTMAVSAGFRSIGTPYIFS